MQRAVEVLGDAIDIRFVFVCFRYAGWERYVGSTMTEVAR